MGLRRRRTHTKAAGGGLSTHRASGRRPCPQPGGRGGRRGRGRAPGPGRSQGRVAARLPGTACCKARLPRAAPARRRGSPHTLGPGALGGRGVCCPPLACAAGRGLARPPGLGRARPPAGRLSGGGTSPGPGPTAAQGYGIPQTPTPGGTPGPRDSLDCPARLLAAEGPLCPREETQVHRLTWHSRCARPLSPVSGQNGQAGRLRLRICGLSTLRKTSRKSLSPTPIPTGTKPGCRVKYSCLSRPESNSTLPPLQEGQYCNHHSHFAAEQTEAPKAEVICPKSQNS